MKCGPSNNWKVVDRPSFQNFGKLMKPFGNMSFPISFQMFNVIGNPNIFCSDISLYPLACKQHWVFNMLIACIPSIFKFHAFGKL